MVDPAKTLIGELEREVSALPGASLFPGAGSDAAARFQAAMGRWAPPGFAAFLSAHDGGVLGAEIKILPLAESTQRRAESERGDGGRAPVPSPSWPAGLWPVMERAGRRFALDAEEAT